MGGTVMEGPPGQCKVKGQPVNEEEKLRELKPRRAETKGSKESSLILQSWDRERRRSADCVTFSPPPPPLRTD